MVLQINWLSKSIEIQENTFDQNVNHVLRLVSDDIEKREFVTMLDYISSKSDINRQLHSLRMLKDSIRILRDSMSVGTNNVQYNFRFHGNDTTMHLLSRDSFRVEISDDEREMKVITGGVKKGLDWIHSQQKELQELNEEIDSKIYFVETEDIQAHALKFDSIEIAAAYSSTSGKDVKRTGFLRKRAYMDVVFNPIIKERHLEANYVDSLFGYLFKCSRY